MQFKGRARHKWSGPLCTCKLALFFPFHFMGGSVSGFFQNKKMASSRLVRLPQVLLSLVFSFSNDAVICHVLRAVCKVFYKTSQLPSSFPPLFEFNGDLYDPLGERMDQKHHFWSLLPKGIRRHKVFLNARSLARMFDYFKQMKEVRSLVCIAREHLEQCIPLLGELESLQLGPAQNQDLLILGHYLTSTLTSCHLSLVDTFQGACLPSSIQHLHIAEQAMSSVDFVSLAKQLPHLETLSWQTSSFVSLQTEPRSEPKEWVVKLPHLLQLTLLLDARQKLHDWRECKRLTEVNIQWPSNSGQILQTLPLHLLRTTSFTRTLVDMSHLLHEAPCLEELTLLNCELSWSAERAMASKRTVFDKMKRIKIVAPSGKYRGMFSGLYACSNLESLELIEDKQNCLDFPDEGFSMKDKWTRLKLLRLTYFGLDPFRILLEVPLSVETLDIRSQHFEWFIRPFQYRYLPNLASLTISLGAHGPELNLVALIAPGLKHLRILTTRRIFLVRDFDKLPEDDDLDASPFLMPECFAGMPFCMFCLESLDLSEHVEEDSGMWVGPESNVMLLQDRLLAAITPTLQRVIVNGQQQEFVAALQKDPRFAHVQISRQTVTHVPFKLNAINQEHVL